MGVCFRAFSICCAVYSVQVRAAGTLQAGWAAAGQYRYELHFRYRFTFGTHGSQIPTACDSAPGARHFPHSDLKVAWGKWSPPALNRNRSGFDYRGYRKRSGTENEARTCKYWWRSEVAV